MNLPEPAEIHAKAVALGLIDANQDLSEEARRLAITAILNRTDDEPIQDESVGLLLTSTRIPVNDGFLLLELRHFPN